MKWMEKNNVIQITLDLPPIQSKPYGYIEFWNPTLEQLINIAPYLEDNDTIAFVWEYGEPKDLPDFSDIKSDRIIQPFFLGLTKEEAYETYTKNRKALMGNIL